MRILFTHNGADLYGASRCLLRLAGGLAEEGHEVKAVLACDGPLRQRLERFGISVVVLQSLACIDRENFGGLFGIIRFVSRIPVSSFFLWRIVREFRPEIIHTNTSLILTSGIVSRITRTPHVWNVKEFFSEFPALWRFYQWLLYLLSDHVICASGPVAAQFHSRICQRRVSVIHDGIPKEELAEPDLGRIQKFRSRYGLNGQMAIGVVGRIKFGRKGQDVFVKAAALLRQKYPRAKFLCIGSPFPGNEGHLRRLLELVNQCELGDQFVYTGDVEDVQAAYESLDVSVLPSVLPEPFGGVVIESMAMARPVVGTNIGGTVEQIEDGVTGFLVPPGDTEALALALDRLLSNPDLMRQFGENGRRKFLKEFEFAPYYEKIFSVYSRLISRRSHA